MLSIEYADYHVPNNFLTLDNASEWLGITPAQTKIYQRVFGLNTFPVAEHSSAYELMKEMLIKIPIVNSEKVKSINYIIHAHTAQVLCPFGASVVADIKKYFGMDEAIYFGTSLNNCASIFNAIEMAKYLLRDLKQEAHALLLVGDVTFTQSLRLVPNVSVVGDAAAVLVVNNYSSAHQLIAISTASHGEYAKGLWMDQAQRIKFESSFSTLLKTMIDETLNKANISLNNVKLILPHNVNTHFWQSFSKELNVPSTKIFTENILKYAHCFGADVVMNLVEAMKKNDLKKGDYYLMITAGLGVTLGAALFQY